MTNATRLSEAKNGVVTLTLDLPEEKVNKLSAPMILELEQVFEKLAANKSIKLLVIESAKSGIFIAGADIEEIKNLTEEADALVKVKRGQDLMNKLEALPFPTLAVINGACLGGGMEFALACTYRVATENKKAQLGLPEVNLGIFPGFGGTQRAPKLLGLIQGLTVVTSGRALDGTKAAKIGLVDDCIPEGYLDQQLPEFIQKVLDGKVKRKDLRPLLEKLPFLHPMIFKKTRAEILKNTKGHYPAPMKAVDVIESTYGKTSLEKGLEIERTEFAKLCIGDICKNLIQIFYTSEALKKDDGTGGAKVKPKEISSAGLLGAGVMGGGIAWAFTKANVPVRMKDINWEGVGLGFTQVAKIYSGLKKKRRMKDPEINLKMNMVSGTLDYSGFANTDIVVEAIVEDIGIKQKVLAETETKVRKDTIIASNTSSLSISKMAVALARPENFVGMHFFNPVNKMPLVEVIPGEKTSPEAIATIFALAKKMGKTPVKVGDCAGFLVNRILLPYMNEAVLMLEQGVSIERIDKVMEKYGMPMGPFVLADEVGIDVCYKVAKILHDSYGDRMVLSELLKTIYERKILGKKAGKGFYVHGQEKNSERTVNAEIGKSGDNPQISDQEIIDRCILLMVNEAAMCLEEGIAENPAYLDMAMIMGTGFPAFRGGLCRYADAVGTAEVVTRLKDLETKYGKRFKPAKLLGKTKKFYS